MRSEWSRACSAARSTGCTIAAGPPSSPRRWTSIGRCWRAEAQTKVEPLDAGSATRPSRAKRHEASGSGAGWKRPGRTRGTPCDPCAGNRDSRSRASASSRSAWARRRACSTCSMRSSSGACRWRARSNWCGSGVLPSRTPFSARWRRACPSSTACLDGTSIARTSTGTRRPATWRRRTCSRRPAPSSPPFACVPRSAAPLTRTTRPSRSSVTPRGSATSDPIPLRSGGRSAWAARR